MADAVVGMCVASCDQSVAGADKGNQTTSRNTLNSAVSRGSRRAFARVRAVTHMRAVARVAIWNFYPTIIFRGVEHDDSIDVRTSEGERMTRSGESRTPNFLSTTSLHARAA